MTSTHEVAGVGAGLRSARRRGRPGHDLAAVVAAGTAVFTERGYDAATMDDVAAALGIAKSSVYHHVSGKEEILQHALDRALGALEDVFAAAETGGNPQRRPHDERADVDARLEHAVRGAVAALVRELPSVTLLLRVRGNSAVERAAVARRRAIDARLADLVRSAARAGALRPDIDPGVVSRLIFGMVNSLTEWYRPRSFGTTLDHGRPDSDMLADAVCALVFDGLRRPLAAIGKDGA